MVGSSSSFFFKKNLYRKTENADKTKPVLKFHLRVLSDHSLRTSGLTDIKDFGKYYCPFE